MPQLKNSCCDVPKGAYNKDSERGHRFDAFDALKRGDADGYVMARTVSALV